MILLTGSGGFLGKEIIAFFQSKSYSFVSVGRSQHNLIQCDLSNQIPAIPSIDMVVYAAGKAHIVPKNAEEGKDFFTVNARGAKFPRNR